MTIVYARKATLDPKHPEVARYLITAQGHATGNEKVCAGVSAILYSLAGWIVNNEQALVYHTQKLKSGDAALEWWGGIEAKTAFDMAVIGMLQIEKKYPENIEVRS